MSPSLTFEFGTGLCLPTPDSDTEYRKQEGEKLLLKWIWEAVNFEDSGFSAENKIVIGILGRDLLLSLTAILPCLVAVFLEPK